MKNFILLSTIALFLFACNQKPPAEEKILKASVKKEKPVAPKDTTLERLNAEIRKDLDNPKLYIERCKLYLERKDYEASKADVDRAYLLDTTNLNTLIFYADYWLKVGQISYARTVLDRANTLHPKNSEVHTKYSELYLIARNNTKSLEYADLAVKYDIYNPKPYFYKGFNFMELGDTTKAISSYQTAVEQDPNYYEAYLELGLIFAMKKDKLAIEYYDNALEIRPNERNVKYSKAMFMQETGMYNEAIQTYHELTKMYPDFKEAFFNLGYIHMFYLKINSQAVQYYTDAVNIDPNYYQAYFNRGYCFELMGDINNAAKDYRYTLSLKPDYDNAAKGLERVTADL